MSTFLTSKYPCLIVSGRESSMLKGWIEGVATAILDSGDLIVFSELLVMILSGILIIVDFSCVTNLMDKFKTIPKMKFKNGMMGQVALKVVIRNECQS